MGACVFCRGSACEEKARKQIGFHLVRVLRLIVRDQRRSAIRNLVRAGVPEKTAMAISGHKTRSVFDRYTIVATEDITIAMRRVEVAWAKALPAISEILVKK